MYPMEKMSLSTVEVAQAKQKSLRMDENCFERLEREMVRLVKKTEDLAYQLETFGWRQRDNQYGFKASLRHPDPNTLYRQRVHDLYGLCGMIDELVAWKMAQLTEAGAEHVVWDARAFPPPVVKGFAPRGSMRAPSKAPKSRKRGIDKVS